MFQTNDYFVFSDSYINEAFIADCTECWHFWNVIKRSNGKQTKIEFSVFGRVLYANDYFQLHAMIFSHHINSKALINIEHQFDAKQLFQKMGKDWHRCGCFCYNEICKAA